jgi:glycosyltransferase involved in cell wall biosynthesis
LLEYCAAGIPVVTTDIPEVRKYGDSVRVAGGDDAFVDAVRAAIAAGREEARTRGQSLARRNAWSRRAGELLEIIDDVVAARRALPSGAGR